MEASEMAGFRRAEIPREQLVLWEQRLEDAVPMDHPVRQVDAMLRSGAFGKTFERWERRYVLVEGKPPYHPRDVAALYVYGMLNGIRSSRQLEAACHNRIDVMWLMSGQCPDHSTIAAFVTAHSEGLRDLMKDVLEVGIRARLIKTKHVAVDGTKVEADVGKGSVRREGTIAEALCGLDEQIAALEAAWRSNEVRESNLLGEEVAWTPGRCGTDSQRLARMKRQQERLRVALRSIGRRREASAGRKSTRAVCSVTDPDSRVMPDKEKRRKPNFNAQLAVDVESGAILAETVNDETEDSGQLTPMLARVKSNCGAFPEEASADSQYNTGPELAALEQKGVVGYLPDSGENSGLKSPDSPEAQAVAAARSREALSDAQWEALPKDGKGRITKVAFRYDREADVYRCPMGSTLRFVGTSRLTMKWGVAVRRRYRGGPACRRCARASVCCENPTTGRTVNRDQYEDHRERMRARMSSERGRSRYRLRRQTVEPRFGQIKRNLGIRRFLRRGLRGVRTEWTLACLAVNLGILLRHWQEVQAVL
jgi:transposase